MKYISKVLQDVSYVLIIGLSLAFVFSFCLPVILLLSFVEWALGARPGREGWQDFQGYEG